MSAHSDDLGQYTRLDRHPAIESKMKYFAYDHLPAGPMRDTSAHVYNLAWLMHDNPDVDGEQLTLGLQKLLEAKDCFVRAALPRS